MKRLLSLLVVMALVVSMIVPTTYASTDIDFDELVGTATTIEDIFEIAVNLEADSNGHNYLWTPEVDGTLTLTVGEVAEGKEVEVIIVQGENSAKLSESADNTVSMDVVAGTRVVIRVYEVNNAALEVTLNGEMVTSGLSAEDPIILFELAEQLKVPAGQTRYFAGRFTGMIMTLEGENVSVENNGTTYTAAEGIVSFEVAGGNFFNPPVIAITNNGTADATYSVRFEYPVGSQMNPEAVRNPSSIAVKVEAGDDQGYFLKWVSQGKGTLTLTAPVIEGVAYDVTLTNNTTYVMNTLSESEDNTVSIETSAGDEIIIQVVGVPDEQWNIPAVETTLTGAFEFAIGTLENPEAIFNPTNIQIAVEAGNSQGYYYSWFSRNEGTLVLTCPEIEGTEYDVILTNNSNSQQNMLSESEDNTVAIDVKNGDQVIIQVVAIPDEEFNYPAIEAAFTGEFVFPIGSRENPEAIFNPTAIDVDIAAGNSQGYYYSWYSRNEGELVLTAPVVEGVEYDVILTNMTTYASAYLSDSEDGTVKLAVKAGDQVVIQVSPAPDANWDYPALQTTLAGEFVFPIGSRENPEPVIKPANIAVAIEAGNNQGYFYKWVSHAKGTLTLTCPAVEGVEYDVTLTNNTTYVMNMLSESEDNTVSIDTNIGDEIIIQVVAVPDAEWNYPAVETAFTGEFEFAPGTLENPAVVFDPTEVAISLEEGNSQGYYFTVYNRMADADLSFVVSEITEGVACDVILTNGNVIAALSESEDGSVKVAIKPGDSVLVQVVAIPAEGTFEYPAAEIKLAGEIIYPVGTQMNPEAIFNPETIEVDIAAGNNQGYYYSWYSRSEGELVLTAPIVEGIEYDVILTNMTDYTMAWLSDSEDGTVSMAVKPGDQVLIQVAVAPDAEWNYPALQTTLEGEFVFPVGSQMNPEAIFNPETIEIDIAAGNSQGYYYSWYSRNEGELVLTAPVVEGIEYDVILTNMTDYTMAWLSDSEDGTVSMAVKPGDQVLIQVAVAPDAEWNYPALQTTLEGEFVFPVGSQMNPEAVWDLTEIVANIAEGNSQGYYYSFYNRGADAELKFTVSSETEGVEYDVILTNMNGYAMAWLSDSEDGTVKMDIKPGDEIIIQVAVAPDADWNYPAATIKLAGEIIYPVGTQMNPEVLVNPETINTHIAAGNNQGYFYSYTHEGKDGTITLNAIEATEGVEYDVILTNMTDYTMAWLSDSEDGTVSIGVKNGEQIIMQVVVSPDAEWNYPAADIKLEGSFETAEVLEGWQFIDRKWYYYKDGEKVTGWLKDGNFWYYFNADGIMQTGWKQLGKNWFYFYSGGNMASGWAKISGVYYYFDANGYMQTGWIQDGGVWYYLKSSGAMATGWQQVGSTWYYFKSSGAMATGWLQQGGVWYYLKSSGAMATGWQKIGGAWYCFDASGAMLTGLITDGVNFYYCNADGTMHTGWLQVDGAWYYFNTSGAMVTGWLQLGGKWYAFDSSYEAYGEMIVGWASDGTNDYYFDSNGVMVTGRVKIDGKWYTFNNSGILVS